MTTARVSARTKTAPTSIVRAGAIAGVASIVVNLIIFGLARAADVTMQVPETMGSTVFIDLLAPAVIGASVIGVVAATVFALVLSRFTDRWLRPFQIIAAVLAVVSLASVFAASTAGGAVVLGIMHLVVGIAVIGAFTREARVQAS